MVYLLATFVISTLTLVCSNVITTDSKFELLILHNNDMHARFEQTSQLSGVCNTADREAGKCYGGFPRVAHVVKEARRAASDGTGPPVLYLNAGDTYTGTAWFTIYKWRIAAECINALRPDAVSLGNHEFDEGVSGLSPFIRNLTVPVLAANLILDKEPELEKEKNLLKSTIFDINGVKVGVIGYLTPETMFLADRNNVQYIEEVIAVRKEVKNLQSRGVNILIALGHSGYPKDIEIAREVEGIDLVIGGHSNTFLWNGSSTDSELPDGPYPTMIQQKSGRMVPVVQAYAYTKYLGKLLLTFNSKGEIIKYEGAPILLDNSIPQDPELLKVIYHYSAELTRITEEVVGNSTVILNGICRLGECNIGNLITDACVDYYVNRYKQNNWTNVPISILQGGRIRSSIAHHGSPFPLTHGDWITVLPFSGYLVIVTMNGSVLLQALEHSVASWRPLNAPGEFLQLSGVKVAYDLAKPPGNRIVDAQARCSNCIDNIYEDIRKDREYKVMMPNFLSEGGDGFEMFDYLPTEKLPFDEVKCVIEYVRRNSPVNPKLTGRIRILNAEALSKQNSANNCKYERYLVTLVIFAYMFL